MAKMIVVDSEERERIREALKRYKEVHGVGDVALAERMVYLLDPQDQRYLKWKSLQRFLTGKHRTEDETVLRYKKFLQRTPPTDFAEQAGTLIAAKMLYPVNYKAKPVSAYQGRYEMHLRPYGAEGDKAEIQEIPARQWILYPSRDPRFLQIITVRLRPPEKGEGDDPIPEILSGGGLFMRCGMRQYLAMSAGFADAWFTLLTESARDPLTLEGALISTNSSGESAPPVYRLQLVQLQGVKEQEDESAE